MHDVKSVGIVRPEIGNPANFLHWEWHDKCFEVKHDVVMNPHSGTSVSSCKSGSMSRMHSANSYTRASPHDRCMGNWGMLWGVWDLRLQYNVHRDSSQKLHLKWWQKEQLRYKWHRTWNGLFKNLWRQVNIDYVNVYTISAGEMYNASVYTMFAWDWLCIYRKEVWQPSIEFELNIKMVGIFCDEQSHCTLRQSYQISFTKNKNSICGEFCHLFFHCSM